MKHKSSEMFGNEKQTRAYKAAIDGHNLLLLGTAGTGKSYVVGEIYRSLVKKGKVVQLCCSTGIATTVYPPEFRALTIHKFSGIDDGRHDPSDIVRVLKNNAKYDNIVKGVMKTDTLIVDECSMVSERTFHSLKNICEMKDNSKVFGGIQIIFVGDFFQLPPVPNKWYNDGGNYCFKSKYFHDVFPYKVVLTKNMRQNEESFVGAIDDIYKGLLTPNTEKFIDLLKRPLPSHCESVKLFSTNSLVDDYNRHCLINSTGIMYEIKSADTGDASELKFITAPKTLWLKVGCPVILLRNLSNILVNGLRGKLTHVTDTELTIYFPTLKASKNISKETFTVFDPTKNVDIASRLQFPVKPAYALTIHKAQGMTLQWVEIDCRDIFKNGQLGVAMSRAVSSEGLRIINFHPRYIFRPPDDVNNFTKVRGVDLCEDLTCCRLERHETQEIQSSENTQTIEECPINYFNDENELEDDFNSVIAALDFGGREAEQFRLPENFDIKLLLCDIRFKNEVTSTHCKINAIISQLSSDMVRLETFIKKLFCKFSTFGKSFDAEMQKCSGRGLPESILSKFYQQVFNYTTSIDYIMNCIELYNVGADQVFEEEHKIVSYLITEYIRQFILEKCVTLLKSNSRQVIKRFITDPSKSRIRYVAGYCISKVRKKYTNIKHSKVFANSKDNQIAYKEASVALQIVNSLKEDEDFLKINTSEPDSLLDTERRQNIRRGLMNVNDDIYKFFLQLTNICLSHLFNDNLTKYGKTMFANCIDILNSENKLFEQFAYIVVTNMQRYVQEDFVSTVTDFDFRKYMDQMILCSESINKIYSEIVHLYFMVLFSQFCRDVKNAFHIEKTMAHRKQIKISKNDKKSTTIISDKGKHVAMKNVYVETKSTAQAGTSTDDSDLCRRCKRAEDPENDDWIQCDSCNSWLHRNCAGLKNKRTWKKFSKPGAVWCCKDCQ